MSRSEDPKNFENRKKDHIKFSIDEGSQIDLSPSEEMRLIHDPLTDVNFKDIEIKTTSKILKDTKPFMVSSMTGGHQTSYEINKTLLTSCKNKNWSFSTGSLRKELELINTDVQDDEWMKLSKEFKESVELIGNIGVAQVISHKVDDFQKLVDRYSLKSLYVHLNPLQEVIQEEGTTNFRGSVEAIKELKSKLSVPVFLKETGTGFSKQSFEKIKDLGLSAVDVSGLGGTHWGRIEGMRSNEGSKFDQASRVFQDWGMTTVESLECGRQVLGESSTELWASGGLRSGLDAAICFALGAKVCGFASPIMKEALSGVSAVEAFMEQIEYELRIALFCTGSGSLNRLDYGKLLL